MSCRLLYLVAIASATDKPNNNNKSEFIRKTCQKTQIEVFVPKWTVGGAGSSAETVMFDSALGKNCRGSQFNKTHYYLHIDLLDPKRDCGTKRESEGVQVIYKNRLLWNDRDSRAQELLANITCTQYLEEKHIKLAESDSVNKLQAGPIQIETKMKLFQSKEYIDEVTGFREKGYTQVGVGEFIYVQIGFVFEENDAAMPNDMVVIERCWGSRSSNPNNMKTAHVMIANGCTADSGVIIKHNGASEIAHWKFQMFKWKSVAQHEQFIYLHCKAWICTDCKKPEPNHACLGDITQFRKRRRRAVSLYQDRDVVSDRSKIFSVGPIYPEDGTVPLLSDAPEALRPEIPEEEREETPEEKEDNFVMAVIIGSVSGFCALFLLIVLVVFVRKYKEKPFEFCVKPKAEEEDEKKIEQGFVFELRSSTDPVIPRLNLDQFRGRNDDIKEKQEQRLERRSHHGSRISLRDDRGRRRRDRSESRDRKRSRSESRRRGSSRERASSKERNRDRSRSRERSSRHGSREKLHSSSRDLHRSDRDLHRSSSKSNLRGSKDDVRRSSRHDLSRSRSKDDLSDGRKMRRSRSRHSLSEHKLTPLAEDTLSTAEQELLHAIKSLKKTNSIHSLTAEDPIQKSESRQNLTDERSPNNLRKSRSRTSVKRDGDRTPNRMRRSESRHSVSGKGRSDSRDRRHRSPSRDKRHRSPSRDRGRRSESSTRDRRHRSPSREARKRSDSRNPGGGGESSAKEEKPRERQRSRDRTRRKSRDHGSRNDLAKTEQDATSSGPDRGNDGQRRRRKKNRERVEDPNEAFSAL